MHNFYQSIPHSTIEDVVMAKLNKKYHVSQKNASMFQPNQTTWEHFFWDTLYNGNHVSTFEKKTMLDEYLSIVITGVLLDTLKQVGKIWSGLDLSQELVQLRMFVRAWYVHERGNCAHGAPLELVLLLILLLD